MLTQQQINDWEMSEDHKQILRKTWDKSQTTSISGLLIGFSISVLIAVTYFWQAFQPETLPSWLLNIGSYLLWCSFFVSSLGLFWFGFVAILSLVVIEKDEPKGCKLLRTLLSTYKNYPRLTRYMGNTLSVAIVFGLVAAGHPIYATIYTGFLICRFLLKYLSFGLLMAVFSRVPSELLNTEEAQ